MAAVAFVGTEAALMSAILLVCAVLGACLGWALKAARAAQTQGRVRQLRVAALRTPTQPASALLPVIRPFVR